MAVLLTVGAVPLRAMADDATSAQEASPPQLQEVTVTATRREESAAKVPISMNVLTGADMAKADIKNIADVAAATPGLQFSTPAAPSTITTINIRGINTSTGFSTTGIYLDDTPLQTRLSPLGNIGGPLPLVNDLSRVEVERGPQGTLFGAGSEAGAVRFITNEPGLTSYGGDVEGEYGTTKGGQPSYELGVAGGGPIADDTLGFRLSAWSRRDGGFVNLINPLPSPSASNATVESDVNRDYEDALRAALKYQVADVTITPAIYYQRYTKDDSGKFYPAYSNLADQDYNDANFAPEHSIDSWSLPSLKVAAALPFASLTFVSSYLHRDVTVNNDFLDCFICFGGSGYGSPLGGDVPTSPADAALTTTGQRNTAYTEELRLASSDPHARATWVAGVFYDDRTQLDYQNTTQLSTNSAGAPVFLVSQTYKDKQVAAFGQTDVRLTTRWIATVGVRVARDTTHVNATLGGAQAGSNPTVIYQSPVAANLTQDPVTPRFVLTYQADDDNLLYASATKGYRIGGGNAPLPAGCTGAGYREGYGSDWIWSYELGAKDRLFDHRLEIDSSVYRMVWSNIQQLVQASPCGISYVSNTGTADSNGFDMSVRALITERMTFDAKINYTNAYYADSVFSGQQPTVLAGDKVGFLPEVIAPWNLDFALQYQFPLANGDVIHFRAEDQYKSHNPGPFENGIPNGLNYVPRLRSDPATNLANLRAGVTVGNVDLAVFVDNVFNSQPLIGSLSYFAVSTPYRLAYSTLRPRTIGVAVNYSFGAD